MSGYYWRRLAGEYDAQKSALDAIREAADAEGIKVTTTVHVNKKVVAESTTKAQRRKRKT